ncbi:FAD-dependent oxidoreductase [Capilliphycus salinus ALCB114379]|uniref:FAD-dependent oxidoreductase n=1 Tax=Capilliphycus salinus TaxID=2768948 RepID=UPI0039A4CCE3
MRLGAEPITVSRSPQVVIVGAGFSGITAGRLLARAGVNVLLIDRNCYHTFIPLLYQVATGFLQPQQVIYPVSRILKNYPQARFLQAEVNDIDFERQIAQTEAGEIDYSYLILATGSQPQFSGVPGASEYGKPLVSLSDAVKLRQHLLGCIEEAKQELNEERRKMLLTFVVVGGGPTGVEMAGGLCELMNSLLAKKYPLFRQLSQVILLQSRDRLLVSFPEKLSRYTAQHLQKMGVKLQFLTRVQRVSREGVELENGTIIPTATTIWTAGVEANPATDTKNLSTARKGKIVVEQTLQIPNCNHVYAIGDVAYVKLGDEPLAGVAPEALQQGEATAHNILRQMRGEPPQPFEYIDKGRAAIIGRNAGVVSKDELQLQGISGWLIWLGIHLYYLPGKSNRLNVAYCWIRDFLQKSRFVQPIIPPYPEFKSFPLNDKPISTVSQGSKPMKYIPLIGRAFLSSIFLYSAITKIFGFAATQEMIAARGLPLPTLMLLGNIIFQLIGGISLILGYKTRIGAVILILFLIPTTLVFHNFLADPGETTAFLKNLALIGALLMISYFGAGPVSLDTGSRFDKV